MLPCGAIIEKYVVQDTHQLCHPSSHVKAYLARILMLVLGELGYYKDTIAHSIAYAGRHNFCVGLCVQERICVFECEMIVSRIDHLHHCLIEGIV